MNEYVIQTEEMNRIMELLFHVLDIRITFFDLREEEVASFHIKEMSSFCREHRKDPLFHARCVECDRLNLARAKQLRDVHIYCCHAGLLEGIVPLYNRRGSYLGAIVYGQLANRKKVPDFSALKFEKSLPKNGKISEYIATGQTIVVQIQVWILSAQYEIDDALNHISIFVARILTRDEFSILLNAPYCPQEDIRMLNFRHSHRQRSRARIPQRR